MNKSSKVCIPLVLYEKIRLTFHRLDLSDIRFMNNTQLQIERLLKSNRICIHLATVFNYSC